MKHVCKRDLLRNPYKHISDEPIMGTHHGSPGIFMSKVDTVDNLNNAIDTLNAFKSSLSYSADGSSPVGDFSNMADYTTIATSSAEMKGLATNIDTITNKPIVQKGGTIKYEKKHSHK